jgi:spore maturation protein CgeB
MKVVFAALKFDYGIKSRGESLELKAFYPALKNNFEYVSSFWLEDNGFPNNLENLQERLLQFVEAEDPAFVFFILMNYEIFPETLLKLKTRYKTVNWFCDDAWRFDSYTKYVAKNFTYCITVDKFSVPKYKEIGCANVILSQWATFDYLENVDLNKDDYWYNVSFIGGKNPTREWFVNYLKNKNIHVECFGAGWDNGKVTYTQVREIFLHSKINLNLSNSVSNDIRFLKYLIHGVLMTVIKIPFMKPINSIYNLRFYFGSIKYYLFGKKRVESIKARNFEISGCGGFQLSQFALEIEDFYNIGKEISVFVNVEDLLKQINYYLFSYEEREKIRIAGHLRTKEHTYNLRIKQVLNSLH